MKRTSALSPVGDISMAQTRIAINPNDGYDLGLMSTAYPVKLHTAVSVEQFVEGAGYTGDGQLLLENTCRVGTVEMNLQVLKKLGRPKKLVLCYE